MSSFQLQKIEERIKNYVPRSQEHKHKENVLNKYKKKNIEVVHINRKVEHDGYDHYGPESNLYDMNVYYREGYNYYIDQWHREDWFNGDDDEPYSLCKYKNKYINYRDRDLVKYIKNNHAY